MSLDDALAGWADTVRLPDTVAEDVYRGIVATPPAGALEAAWWRDFTVGFTSRLVRSTRPVRLVV